ncbi:MAG: cation:proton antiporter [Elusimicrobia bacterium]|nr:cation:proton antiporter [Elusimicrobiota bacterium]
MELSARFFIQLAVILAACRTLAWLGRRALQPAVVCEIVAGILLGPSLLGLLWPAAYAWLFPKAGLAALSAASQVGLALYMFVVGLEFRTDLLAAGWRSSAAVSLAGIAAPLALGAWLGASLTPAAAYFGAGISRPQAMLFTGAALCITAFPVLARIITERGLTGTRLGTMVLGAGAFNDAAAWALLAVLLAGLDSAPSLAALAVGGGLAYVALVFWAVRPAARWFVARHPRAALGPGALPVACVALALAAWYADFIGLHAVFGAFLLGAAMPRGTFADALRAKIEPVTTALLVPLFFAFSGINTRLGLLAAHGMWATAAAVFLVATAGKGAACALAARAGGWPAAESAAVGALMNARGLMELILLNIGLQRGLITPTFFTVLVLMAVATTMAASPAFELLRPLLKDATTLPAPAPAPTARPGAPRAGG